MSSGDRTTLRDLARQVADIAALPIQAERRRRRPVRPMILVSPEGSWQELLPK